MLLLAQGKPVTATELAAVASIYAVDVCNAPAGRDIEYDDRIVGWGSHAPPTAHLHREGSPPLPHGAPRTRRYFRPSSVPARASSRLVRQPTPIFVFVSPSTREPGVTDLSAATAVISIPVPGDGLQPGACELLHPGRFFATAKAAEIWLAEHPDGTVLPVADAYLQLRPVSNRLLDLPEAPSC